MLIGISTSTDTPLNINNSLKYGYDISAVKINSNKVFIAHTYGLEPYYLYGLVCTINGENITAGTDTQLSTRYGGAEISTVLLSNNKVFIAYDYINTSVNIQLYAMVCTIDGENITVGTDTEISNNSSAGMGISAIKISSNKVFIAHSYNSNYYLYGVVCTIDGENITVGTDTQLSTTTDSGKGMSIILLSDNKVFVAHDYKLTSSYYLYGIVCTISGTTITKGTSTSIADTIPSTGAEASAILLSDNKVFITYVSTNSYNLYGIICNINGTRITKGTKVLLNSSSNTTTSLILLSKNNVFIVCDRNNSNNYLYSMICNIEGENITVGNDIQLSTVEYSGYKINPILLDNNKIFIAHSYSKDCHLYGIICDTEKGKVTLVKSSLDEIFGIAKTKGTEGQTVKVYIPKLPEYICTEDENRIITENGEEIRNE